jgi:hypothetical protein
MTFGSSLWLVEYDEQLAKAFCKVGNVNDYQLIMSKASYNQINHQLNQILMKIKDLPENVRLIGAKVKTSKGVIGFVINEFDNGIMLSTFPYKQYQQLDGDEKRLYPQIIENKDDMKDWEIIPDNNIICNCDKLIDHDHIMNFSS